MSELVERLRAIIAERERGTRAVHKANVGGYRIPYVEEMELRASDERTTKQALAILPEAADALTATQSEAARLRSLLKQAVEALERVLIYDPNRCGVWTKIDCTEVDKAEALATLAAIREATDAKA